MKAKLLDKELGREYKEKGGNINRYRWTLLLAFFCTELDFLLVLYK
jgi:hypothetical protein